MHSQFDLWPTNTVSASAASAHDVISGASTTLGATYYANGGSPSNPCPPSGTNVCASVTVIALQRAPLVLMNLSGEVENLSGYGYRYTGEQQFYSFYVNLPNGPPAPTKSDPFQSGVNLVLESRSAFINSTLNGSNGLPPSITSCFGSSAQITTQSPGASDFTSIVGSFSADQVTTSCAQTLLGELEPLSANRTNGNPPMGGTYIFLSSVQAELLGLDSQALTLMPFQSPPTSATGGPPTNDLGSAFGDVVGAFAFAYNALVTGVNFIANLPAELKALGQIILGAIEKVLSAVEEAVQWLANALDILVQIALAIGRAFVNLWVGAMTAFMNQVASFITIPFCSFLADTNDQNGNPILTNAQYSEVLSQEGLSQSAPENRNAADSDQANLQTKIEAISIAAFTAAIVVNVILTGLTAGAWSAFKGALTTTANKLIDNALPKLALSAVGLAGAISLFYGLTSTNSLSTVLQGLGWSASASATAVLAFDAFATINGINSVSWTNLPMLRASLAFGLFASFAMSLISGMLDSLVGAMKGTGDSGLAEAEQTTGFFAAMFGAMALGYITLPLIRLLTTPGEFDPLPLAVLLMGITTFSAGVYFGTH